MIPITAATMVAALQAAKPGDVFGLPPGRSQMPTLLSIAPAGVVTITSQDPRNPAIIAGDFKMDSCANLKFTGLIIDFTTTTDEFWAGRISNTKNLTFADVEVRAAGPTVDWPGGFYVLDSDRVSFTGCSFHDIGGAAINMVRCTNGAVIGNDFNRWGKSAISAAQVQGFSVIGNTVHDAFPTLGTHADGLQIFTQGTTAQSSGIFVAKNRMWVGGGWAFQAIFIQDEVGTLPLLNIVVQDNYLYGTMWDTLWLSNVGGQSYLLRNVAVSWPQRDIESSTSYEDPLITAFTANMFTLVAPGGVLIVTDNAVQGFTDQTGKWVASLPGNSLLPTWPT